MKVSMLAVTAAALVASTVLTEADAKWEIVQAGLAQGLYGVAAPAENTVLASGAAPTFRVFRSTDGGATFDFKLLPDLGLAFGMDAGGPEGSWDAPLGGNGAAVVAGFLSWGYTTNSLKTIDTIFDGTVRSIPDGTPFASLSTRKLSWGGEYTFGMAGIQRSIELGVGTSDEGPAISRDGGKTWTGTRMSKVLTHPIQHADWPTETTWYVTSGSWPTATARRVTSIGGSDFDFSESLSFRNGTAIWKSSEELSAHKNGYGGHIHKTTDGGRTWQLSLNLDNMFFNKIACRDEDVCAAAAESRPDGTALYLTVDGGRKWVVVLELPSGTNLQGAEFVGPNKEKLVAYGGNVGRYEFDGYVFSSTNWMDGSPSWEQETLQRAMFRDVKGVPGSDTMYAIGVETQNSASIMKFTPN